MAQTGNRHIARDAGKFTISCNRLGPAKQYALGLINLALYGMAGVNANNAANYGARVGSVAQTAVLQTAVGAANAKLATTSFGDYAVSASQVGSGRGSLIRLAVTYEVDNYFAGLTSIFGVESSPVFQHTVVSYFRQEGW